MGFEEVNFGADIFHGLSWLEAQDPPLRGNRNWKATEGLLNWEDFV